MKKKLKGFTLIELIICIAIIALLVAIAIPNYKKAKLSAIVAAHNSNVNNLKSAAILANIDGVDVTKESLNTYLEGNKLPDIPKEIGGEWTISIENDDITITPGLKAVKDGKIVDLNSGK